MPYMHTNVCICIHMIFSLLYLRKIISVHKFPTTNMFLSNFFTLHKLNTTTKLHLPTRLEGIRQEGIRQIGNSMHPFIGLASKQ